LSRHDGVFEPLRGKRRTVRQALTEVAERWARHPVKDAVVRAALEDAVRHLLRRGQIDGQLPADTDLTQLAQSFVDGLVRGEGPAAVDRVL